MRPIPSRPATVIAATVLAACALAFASCTQDPEVQSQAMLRIPPPPEPQVIDLRDSGVVIFRVRVDADLVRDFKASNKNLLWVFADSGTLIARVPIDDTRRTAINQALNTGAPNHPVRYQDAALRQKIHDAIAAGKKVDVLLTLAYGTKGVATITGTAASYRPDITIQS